LAKSGWQLAESGWRKTVSKGRLAEDSWQRAGGFDLSEAGHGFNRANKGLGFLAPSGAEA